MRSIYCLIPFSFFLLIGSAGCNSGFWDGYATPNRQACLQLMTACFQTPEACTPTDFTVACGQVVQLSNDYVDARPHKELDVLFLIDNSLSMSPKQAALAKNIPKFIQVIDGTGANYHVGFATSDIGSNFTPGRLWGGPEVGTCDTYAGDNGMLQAVACSNRSFSSPAGSSACNSLCPDTQYVPQNGARFISKVDGVTNVPVDMQFDTTSGKMVDRGPSNAFQCMALVGDDGCALESPLEAARRALDGRNVGFLRDNSFLTVVYITDEDDCSVQMARRNELDPKTMVCDPAQPDSYHCYQLDYRCLARSLTCNESMMTAGVKTGCKERPDNFLEPLQKYYNFFTTLRPKEKLLISGIWTAPSIQKNGHLEIVQSGTTTATLNRGVRTAASCAYAGDPDIYGQAQYRLSQFAAMFGTSHDGSPVAMETSVCDVESYAKALDTLGDKLTSMLRADCLTVKPQTWNGQPICVVGDVNTSSINDTPFIPLAQCSTNCCSAWATVEVPHAANLTISAACGSEAADCFCASPSTVNCTATAVAGVWRKGGAAPPAGKAVNFRCAAAPMGP